jgi:leucyl/phenylalanyl-tRNA--protein transferase
MLWYAEGRIPYVLPPQDCDALADWMEASYPDEFLASSSFDPGFVDDLCWSGFIPMAAEGGDGQEYLTPKMHVVRSIMPPGDVLVTRTTRRQSTRYELRLDTNFAETLKACIATHGDGWLRPPLVESWTVLFESRSERKVKFSSMEVYSSGRLAAGEIGFFAGGSYTSLTGFRRESGAGSVQLAATARFLEACGVQLWDLGMPLEYKRRLGAEIVQRSVFIPRFRRARESRPAFLKGPFPARSLIDMHSTVRPLLDPDSVQK